MPGKAIRIALLLALSLVPLSADDEAVAKKGICLAGKGEDTRAPAARIESLNVGWHYNWTPKWPGKNIRDVQFVPMFFGNNPWSMSARPDLKVSKSKGETSPLLGFNEPDGKKQANMSVKQALDLWPVLEKTNRRLGSPATVHPDNPWMMEFMKEAKSRGHRVDFVCVHWYGGADPEQLLRVLEKTRRLYGKPIWITEFAVADWSAETRKDNRHSERDVLRFMKKILPKLEKLDYVERYAWFTASPDNAKLGSSALFDADGNLTELGELYSSHGQ